MYNNVKFDAVKVIPVIEAGLQAEKLILEVERMLNNRDKCTEIQQRIYEAEILLSSLHLNRLGLGL